MNDLAAQIGAYVYRNDTLRPGFWSSVGLSPWTRYDKVIEVVRKADMHTRWGGREAAWGLGPVHPYDAEFLARAYGIDPRAAQPWLWVYPPLVVDREWLGMRIATLMDPTLATRTWVYDQFGLVVSPHQASIIAAIERGEFVQPLAGRKPWASPSTSPATSERSSPS